MNTARDNHAALLLPDGRVLVSGGRYFNGDLNLFEGIIDCEIYDPNTNEWTSVGSSLGGHSYHSMHLISEDLVLLPGGTNHSGIDVDLSYSDTELFDIDMNEWVDGSSLGMTAGGRFQHASTLLNSGDVIVCGGDGVASSSGEIYQQPTSLIEMSQAHLEVFPNPVQEFLFVRDLSLQGGILKLTSSEGKLVRTQNCLTGSSTAGIDCADLPAGTYHLMWIGADGTTLNRSIVHN